MLGRWQLVIGGQSSGYQWLILWIELRVLRQPAVALAKEGVLVMKILSARPSVTPYLVSSGYQ